MTNETATGSGGARHPRRQERAPRRLRPGGQGTREWPPDRAARPARAGRAVVEALASRADISVALASAHLQGLRRAALVAARRDGNRILYRLADDDVYALLASLRTVASRLGEAERAAARFLGVPQEAVTRVELVARVRSGDAIVVDLRPADEFEAGHIAGALSIPLPELEARLAELPADVEIVAYCRGPYCAMSPQARRAPRARRAAGTPPRGRLSRVAPCRAAGRRPEARSDRRSTSTTTRAPRSTRASRRVMRPLLDGPTRNPSALHPGGREARRRHRPGSRPGRGPARRDTRRDRLHERRQRGEQRRAAGRVVRAGPRAPTTSSRQPSSTRRSSSPPGSSSGSGARVTILPVDRHRPGRPRRRPSRDHPAHVPRLGHARQQRGRHDPADRRDRAPSHAAAGVLLHTDAAQSVGKIPTRVDELGVDLLSIAGHKVYAPKGDRRALHPPGRAARAPHPRRRPRVGAARRDRERPA